MAEAGRSGAGTGTGGKEGQVGRCLEREAIWSPTQLDLTSKDVLDTLRILF